jgi:hypothetical protein
MGSGLGWAIMPCYVLYSMIAPRGLVLDQELQEEANCLFSSYRCRLPEGLRWAIMPCSGL